MRILLINNYYQLAGGESACFEAERNLLQQFGHEVVTYTRHNNELNDLTLWETPGTAIQTIWARDSYQAIVQIITEHKPDIAHFTNFFPLISPSAYYACQRNGVPVVQSLHNYRLLCPAATFYRDGYSCEKCLKKRVPWPGVLHRCYRDSLNQSLTAAAMLSFHNFRKTWSIAVNRYIAISEFSKQKFIEGGLLAEKISVKPNYIDPVPDQIVGKSDYALFVGRLVPEKGIMTLLEAWAGIPFTLKVVGDGPLFFNLSFKFQSQNIKFLGWQPHDHVIELMQQARFLVFPSEWYELMPMTILEAMACGLPVVGVQFGVMEELIVEMETGRLFKPGDHEDLHRKIKWMLNHPLETAKMGVKSRTTFEEKYTAVPNYQRLISIYLQAHSEFHKRR